MENDLQCESNRTESISRQRKFDVEVSVYAAVYAQLLVSFEASTTSFTPGIYCQRNVKNNRSAYQKFKNAFLSCTVPTDCLLARTSQTWIELYQFKTFQLGSETTRPEIFNLRRAIGRDKQEDEFLSIWVVGYSTFLDDISNQNDAISVGNFCKGLGHEVDNRARRMPFMTLKETKRTCEEWIVLSGYNENIMFNQIKAKKSTWTKRYIDHFRKKDQSALSSSQPEDNRSRYQPSSSSGQPEDDECKDLLTPKLFCKQFASNFLGFKKTYKYHFD